MSELNKKILLHPTHNSGRRPNGMQKDPGRNLVSFCLCRVGFESSFSLFFSLSFSGDIFYKFVCPLDRRGLQRPPRARIFIEKNMRVARFFPIFFLWLPVTILIGFSPPSIGFLVSTHDFLIRRALHMPVAGSSFRHLEPAALWRRQDDPRRGDTLFLRGRRVWN